MKKLIAILLVLVIIQMCNLFGVAGNRIGLTGGIPVFTEGRIQQQGQSYNQNQY